MGEARIIPFDGGANRQPGSARANRAARRAQRPIGPVETGRRPREDGEDAAAGRDDHEIPVHKARRRGSHPTEVDPTAGRDGEVPVREAGPRTRPEPAPDDKGEGEDNSSTAAELGRALLGAAAGRLGAALGGLAQGVAGPGWEDKAADGLAFLRRRVTGDYEVDDFGFDPELNDAVFMSILRPLYDKYFRVEVQGLENIPAEGGALVVANHSGTLPLDALMTQVAVHDHHPGNRSLRLLGADLLFKMPVVGELARKSGHTMACHADAERLLSRGELVGVWPEGYKGLGKPFRDRYKLQRFGRGGFVSAALRTGVPIIPCSIVGAEEIYPMLANAKTVARVFGLPYFPVTPTFPLLGPLGLVPLPSRWHIRFGEPIRTDTYLPETADDPMTVFNLTDEVRETIQHTIYRQLMQRRSVFF